MLDIWLYTLISVVIVSLISFAGSLFFLFKGKNLESILIYMVSFSAGALFGDAFIHLIPEVVEKSGFGLMISLYVLSGIALSFIIEKIIHWRHCHIPITKKHKHPFAYMNLFGDGVHNFIDGLIIGASYLVSIPIGITTTIAVVLHEIPQEIGDFGVLLHGGFSKNKALFFNFITALTAVLGALVALSMAPYIQNLTVFLISFAAGSFIYIAGSDLIPELHKECRTEKSLMQLVFFILGIAIMFLLLILG